MGLREQKQVLRKSVQQKLKELSSSDIEKQSDRVLNRLFETSALKNAAGVSVYLSMSGEVVTYAIVQRLFKAGKKVYVPCITGPNHQDMRMIELTAPTVIEDWPKNKWGIPEPSPESISSDIYPDVTHQMLIDTVLCPAVAFNSDCTRLGHGKGYYDSFLNRSNALRIKAHKSPIYTIGLGLSPQLIEHKIPTDQYDVQLDAVVTPDATFFSNAA